MNTFNWWKAIVRRGRVSDALAMSGCVLLMAWFTGCATSQFDPVTGRKVRNMYTLNEDVDLGRQVVGDLIQSLQKEGIPLNQDQAKLNTLSNMMHRITAVSHYPDLPYSVTLVHTNLVNAACAPGGQLIVWEGLYSPEIGLVEDDDELAFVMAHEIAHATSRHTTRNITRTMPVNVLLMGGAVIAELADSQEWAAAFGAAFVVYHGVILPRYSRQDEHEADRLGIQYMAKAGYDPRAAPRIWRRARDRHGDAGLMQYFSSHPSHRNRYRELETLLPEAMEHYREATGRYPPGYAASSVNWLLVLQYAQRPYALQ